MRRLRRTDRQNARKPTAAAASRFLFASSWHGRRHCGAKPKSSSGDRFKFDVSMDLTSDGSILEHRIGFAAPCVCRESYER
jgi:hypothetical protein